MFATDLDRDEGAWLIERDFPGCHCQNFSVSAESPGIVKNEEKLFRFFVSPGDVDPDRNGEPTLTAFRRAALNGLSCFRECATDADIEALAVDRLTTVVGQRRRTILALFSFYCRDVRSNTYIDGFSSFCVYDETVDRAGDKTLPRVPTHANLYQRVPTPGMVDRKLWINKLNSDLYKIISPNKVDIASFRDGLIAKLNDMSLAGHFERE